eukprot:CAMPEP_0204593138 /NCGR_PEP_ID=MMETSP0661-20131031/51337_1 /ASSEMBLY_ACC=CAM_ASM_000606 /TAXON_ID=109239 /ORGANISM="Alexandrium margalefi, Strain AMGDE01CS-322" /LENGTH=334 /DNA_ID=CAMNT_0051603423 /DNA_START=48 /DNA_END=1049 /DNA_ORIENTATION=-
MGVGPPSSRVLPCRVPARLCRAAVALAWFFSTATTVFSEFSRTAMRKSRESRGLQSRESAGRTSCPIAKQVMESTPPGDGNTATQISAAADVRNWDGAFARFWTAPSKSTIVYNAIIHAALRCGRYEKGIDLYREMSAIGLTKTSPTYCSALKLLGKLGRYSEAIELWDELPASRLLDDKGNSRFLYSAIMEVAAQAGNVNDAQFLLAEMQAEGIVPDVITYGNVLNACKNSLDAASAREVLAEMVDAGVMPNEIIFTLVMASHRGAPVTEIDELVEDLRRQGLGLSRHFVEEHVSSLIGAYLPTRDMHDTVQALQKLHGDRIRAIAAVIEDAR